VSLRKKPDSPEDHLSLPPRQAWEEPPADGWTSYLGGLGLETLAVAGAFAALVGIWRLVELARRLEAESVTGAAQAAHAAGGRSPLSVVIWGAVCLLAAALVVLVWKRLGGIAFIGAMLTDHGRVARFGGRPPIWLDRPPAGLRLVHLSDLHVTEGERVRLVERRRPGGTAVLPTLLNSAELKSADVILVTGDVTDRGTALAWRCFLDLVARAGLTDKLIIVPGNHDLALVDPFGGLRDFRGTWYRNDRFGLVQLANLLKFCEAFASTGGGRRGQVLAGGAPVPYAEAWAAVEREVRPLVAELPSLPVPRQRLGRGYFARRARLRAYEQRIASARGRLQALFPVAVPLPEHEAVLFVLNSCTPVCRHPATNGLGWVGRPQYRRLRELAGFFAQPLKLLALHHHVVRRSEELSHRLLHRIVAKFTVLGDAGPLVRFCRAHKVRAVFNGHRHLSYKLRLPGGTVLIAAPSSTLGDDLARDHRPQFERYDLSHEVAEPTVGIYHEQVWPSPQAQLQSEKTGSIP
jgi:3',5'-cyclic AMP phosphodiesterase CpdA